MAPYKKFDDWDEEFRRWKSTRNKEISLDSKKEPKEYIKEKPSSIEFKKNHLPYPEINTDSKSNKLKIIYLSILILIVSIILYLALETTISNISFSAFIVSLFIFLLMFFAILCIHRVYEKTTKFIHPSFVLSFCYTLIIANMLLSPKIYSLEWAFLGFLVIVVIFYDFKIDSRFLILPALLLLGYIPFLLIGAQKEIAETIAVFVYYFLVVGVVLQIIEHVKKIENSLDFDRIMKEIIKKTNWIIPITIFGLISVGIIIGNRFMNLELWKWTSVYVFAVVMVSYIISRFQEQK